MELTATDSRTTDYLNDYVRFAQACQAADAPLGRGSYRIDGAARAWSEQSDGPALRVLAILGAWTQLDAEVRSTAAAVVAADLEYLLAEYQHPTYSLWEEHEGASFFARSVQLRCLREVRANAVGLPVPGGLDAATAWLEARLLEHWDGTRYVSLLPAPDGYDPNIDVVLAALYGAIPCTDPGLLATAAQLRAQWSDPGSPSAYAINAADRDRDMGPLLGRYPGDTYDGDTRERSVGHPWALCTCAYAELCYRVGRAVLADGPLPPEDRTAAFLEGLGADASGSAASTAQILRDAADRMVRAVVAHSDHLELSEQFDATTGYEKSVRNLTWSYASFLSALRARTALDALHP
jgi:glucoamylase